MFGAQDPAPTNGTTSSGGADDDLESAIQEDREGRGIPHDRVRQMRSSWERKAEQRAMQQARQQLISEFSPVLEELSALREKASQFDPDAVRVGVAKSILKGLGVEEQQPQPRLVTAEEHAKALQQIEQKFQREQQYREDLARATADLQNAKQKYAKTFDAFPVIEELAAAIWGTPYAVRNGVTMGRIVDGLVKQIEDGIGKVNQSYVQEKQADAVQAPIVPGSSTAPGRKPAGKLDYSPEATAKRAIEFLEKSGG
jgi:hypothetical protein